MGYFMNKQIYTVHMNVYERYTDLYKEDGRCLSV